MSLKKLSTLIKLSLCMPIIGFAEDQFDPIHFETQVVRTPENNFHSQQQSIQVNTQSGTLDISVPFKEYPEFSLTKGSGLRFYFLAGSYLNINDNVNDKSGSFIKISNQEQPFYLDGDDYTFVNTPYKDRSQKLQYTGIKLIKDKIQHGASIPSGFDDITYDYIYTVGIDPNHKEGTTQYYFAPKSDGGQNDTGGVRPVAAIYNVKNNTWLFIKTQRDAVDTTNKLLGGTVHHGYINHILTADQFGRYHKLQYTQDTITIGATDVAGNFNQQRQYIIHTQAPWDWLKEIHSDQKLSQDDCSPSYYGAKKLNAIDCHAYNRPDHLVLDYMHQTSKASELKPLHSFHDTFVIPRRVEIKMGEKLGRLIQFDDIFSSMNGVSMNEPYTIVVGEGSDKRTYKAHYLMDDLYFDEGTKFQKKTLTALDQYNAQGELVASQDYGIIGLRKLSNRPLTKDNKYISILKYVQLEHSPIVKQDFVIYPDTAMNLSEFISADQNHRLLNPSYPSADNLIKNKLKQNIYYHADSSIENAIDPEQKYNYIAYTMLEYGVGSSLRSPTDLPPYSAKIKTKFAQNIIRYNQFGLPVIRYQFDSMNRLVVREITLYDGWLDDEYQNPFRYKSLDASSINYRKPIDIYTTHFIYDDEEPNTTPSSTQTTWVHNAYDSDGLMTWSKTFIQKPNTILHPSLEDKPLGDLRNSALYAIVQAKNNQYYFTDDLTVQNTYQYEYTAIGEPFVSDFSLDNPFFTTTLTQQVFDRIHGNLIAKITQNYDLKDQRFKPINHERFYYQYQPVTNAAVYTLGSKELVWHGHHQQDLLATLIQRSEYHYDSSDASIYSPLLHLQDNPYIGSDITGYRDIGQLLQLHRIDFGYSGYQLVKEVKGDDQSNAIRAALNTSHANSGEILDVAVDNNHDPDISESLQVYRLADGRTLFEVKQMTPQDNIATLYIQRGFDSPTPLTWTNTYQADYEYSVYSNKPFKLNTSFAKYKLLPHYTMQGYYTKEVNFDGLDSTLKAQCDYNGYGLFSVCDVDLINEKAQITQSMSNHFPNNKYHTVSTYKYAPLDQVTISEEGLIQPPNVLVEQSNYTYNPQLDQTTPYLISQYFYKANGERYKIVNQELINGDMVPVAKIIDQKTPKQSIEKIDINGLQVRQQINTLDILGRTTKTQISHGNDVISKQTFARKQDLEQSERYQQRHGQLVRTGEVKVKISPEQFIDSVDRQVLDENANSILYTQMNLNHDLLGNRLQATLTDLQESAQAKSLRHEYDGFGRMSKVENLGAFDGSSAESQYEQVWRDDQGRITYRKAWDGSITYARYANDNPILAGVLTQVKVYSVADSTQLTVNPNLPPQVDFTPEVTYNYQYYDDPALASFGRVSQTQRIEAKSNSVSTIKHYYSFYPKTQQLMSETEKVYAQREDNHIVANYQSISYYDALGRKTEVEINYPKPNASDVRIRYLYDDIVHDRLLETYFTINNIPMMARQYRYHSTQSPFPGKLASVAYYPSFVIHQGKISNASKNSMTAYIQYYQEGEEQESFDLLDHRNQVLIQESNIPAPAAAIKSIDYIINDATLLNIPTQLGRRVMNHYDLEGKLASQQVYKLMSIDPLKANTHLDNDQLISSKLMDYDAYGNLIAMEQRIYMPQITGSAKEYFEYDSSIHPSSPLVGSPTRKTQQVIIGDQISQTITDLRYGVNNNVIAINGIPILYDKNGNMIEDHHGNHYHYDAFGYLVKAELANGLTAQYYYDGNGKRIAKSVQKDGNEITLAFVYDGNKIIAEKSMGNDHGINVYAAGVMAYYDPRNIEVPYQINLSMSDVRDLFQDIVYRINKNAILQSGTRTENRFSSAYGDEVLRVNEDGGHPTHTLNIMQLVDVGVRHIINNQAYTDFETNFQILGKGYRYYSPEISSFIQPDQNYNQDFNLYGWGGNYANDPINYLDPYGDSFLSFLKGLGMGIANVFTSFIGGKFDMTGKFSWDPSVAGFKWASTINPLAWIGLETMAIVTKNYPLMLSALPVGSPFTSLGASIWKGAEAGDWSMGLGQGVGDIIGGLAFGEMMGRVSYAQPIFSPYGWASSYYDSKYPSTSVWTDIQKGIGMKVDNRRIIENEVSKYASTNKLIEPNGSSAKSAQQISFKSPSQLEELIGIINGKCGVSCDRVAMTKQIYNSRNIYERISVNSLVNDIMAAQQRYSTTNNSVSALGRNDFNYRNASGGWTANYPSSRPTEIEMSIFSGDKALKVQ